MSWLWQNEGRSWSKCAAARDKELLRLIAACSHDSWVEQHIFMASTELLKTINWYHYLCLVSSQLFVQSWISNSFQPSAGKAIHLLNSGGFNLTILEEGKCFSPFEWNNKFQEIFLWPRGFIPTNKNWGGVPRQWTENDKKNCRQKWPWGLN